MLLNYFQIDLSSLFTTDKFSQVSWCLTSKTKL